MSRILDAIDIPQNRLPEGINNIINSKFDMYLYGTSAYAEKMYEIIKRFNIKLKGVITSDDFYSLDNPLFHGIKIYKFSDIINNYVKNHSRGGGGGKRGINIIIGFECIKFFSLFKNLINCSVITKIYILQGCFFKTHMDCLGCDKIYYVDDYYTAIYSRELNYKYLCQNIDRFNETFELLQDDLSRRTFLKYINGHVNVLNFPMETVRVNKQYFSDDLISLTDEEIFVDCGAYDGDTISLFLEKTDGKFKLIYALEPDKSMHEKLHKNISLLINNMGLNESKEKIIVVEVGAFSHKGEIIFGSKNGCGVVLNTNNNLIENNINVDTIDNIVNGKKVTFIKMDIEGSESEALKGAVYTIKTYKPKLAICVYHKKDDLIRIPQFIYNLVPEYKFYLRCHYDYVSELVLYAVI